MAFFIPYFFLVFLLFLIGVVIMRWAFRINDIVENLEAIKEAISYVRNSKYR
jgi:hypothetical protein